MKIKRIVGLIALAIAAVFLSIGIKNYNHFTYIVKAIYDDKPEIIAKEIESDPRIIQSIGGDSTLHSAAVYGANETIALLLQKGADVNAPDTRGQVPLDGAISHPSTVKVLLEAGADPNALDHSGCSPLHHASWLRAHQTAEYLVAAGGKVNLIDASRHRYTALHYAVRISDIKMVRLLLRFGANPNIGSADGTALQLAVARGDTQIASLLRRAGAKKSGS